MSKLRALFLLPLLLFTACMSPKQKEENLAKEVMAIHDEVMPRMGEISSYRRELKQKLKAQEFQFSAETRVERAEMERLIMKLDSADKGMMDWMHNYNGGQDLYTHKEIMEYLEGEKKAISEVKVYMEATLDETKKYLGK